MYVCIYGISRHLYFLGWLALTWQLYNPWHAITEVTYQRCLLMPNILDFHAYCIGLAPVMLNRLCAVFVWKVHQWLLSWFCHHLQCLLRMYVKGLVSKWSASSCIVTSSNTHVSLDRHDRGSGDYKLYVVAASHSPLHRCTVTCCTMY